MAFDFVITSDDPKNVSQSNRQVIRRRATQAGARTRRREGKLTRVNLLQLPPDLVSHSVSTQAASSQSNSEPSEHSRQEVQPYQPNNSIPLGYIDFNAPIARSLSCPWRLPQAFQGLLEFSKHDMSKMLLGQERHSSIHSQPLRVQKILSLTQQQFFLGIGERYQRSQCLTDAVDCLWVYIQQCLSQAPVVNRNKPVKHYIRSLHSIQTAMKTDNLDWIDVWYATLILILYESFNASDYSWIIHACGAVHILEHLGPQSIVSECQKELLTAQTAIMITEIMFQNKSCFLSRPEWQVVSRSTIIQDSTSHTRSEAAVTLWMHAAHIPGIFQDATNLIVHKRSIDHEELIRRTRSVCDSYQAWYQRWQPQLEPTVQEMLSNQSSELGGPQIEILCCYLEHFCLVNRLLLAIHPAAGIELEETVAETARRTLGIYHQYAALGQPRYRMGLSAFIAETVLATTNQWISDLSSCSNITLSIDREIFLKWCQILRRRVD